MSDPTPGIVADLRTKVHSVNGRGLLGLALDPNFPTTPNVYVMYSHDAPIGGTAPTYGVAGSSNDECAIPGTCVISNRMSRLRLVGNVATSETVIVEDYCQEWTSHSAGDLRFGPDGSLYATSGDGAFAGQPDWGQRTGANPCMDPPIPHGGKDQDPATAEGGALRSQDLRTSRRPRHAQRHVHPDRQEHRPRPPRQPECRPCRQNVARIVAYGLRNPYRTTFRPGTEELWLGDVGWNEWEEINVVTDPDNAVPNFGWRATKDPTSAATSATTSAPISPPRARAPSPRRTGRTGRRSRSPTTPAASTTTGRRRHSSSTRSRLRRPVRRRHGRRDHSETASP